MLFDIGQGNPAGGALVALGGIALLNIKQHFLLYRRPWRAFVYALQKRFAAEIAEFAEIMKGFSLRAKRHMDSALSVLSAVQMPFCSGDIRAIRAIRG